MSMIPFFTFIYLNFFLTLCVYVVHTYVRSCVCLWVYVCHGTHLEVIGQLWVLVPTLFAADLLSILSFKIRGHPLSLSPVSCLTVVVVESWTHTATNSFTVFWESELRSLHLHAKHYIHWATSTALFYFRPTFLSLDIWWLKLY